MNEAPEAIDGTVPSIAHELAHWLTEARHLRQAANADPVRAGRRVRLRQFQADRLADTHVALLSDPDHHDAAQFFLTDLYGPKDLSARDAEIERVLPVLTRTLPETAQRALLRAAEVDALSEHFDAAMVDALGNKLDADAPPLADADYAEAYRAVGDKPGREHQIELIMGTGNTLDKVARKPGLMVLVKVMRGPATLAGLGDLQGFLERGLNAFRSLPKPAEFLHSIVGTEQAVCQSLFAGGSDLQRRASARP